MEMARKAELVAAFRLPTGAFAEYAGTAVVTDIIILRKRDKPIGIVDKENWIEVLEHDTPEGTKVLVNKYFHDNPSHVIGTINFGHGTTTFRPGLIVDRPDNMLEQLRRIVDLVPEGAFRAEQGVKHISYVANHTSDRTNSLVKTPQGLFIVAGEHLAVANDVLKYELKDADKTAERVRELESLISMRQLYGKLIDAERVGDADGPRKALRAAYEAFVKAHGPLSSSFGLNYLRKIDDPFYPSIAALEVRSDGKGGKTVYRPATILTESTMRGARAMANPSIKDAFVLARGEAVNPSLARIAEIAKKTEAEVKADLVEAGAAFDLPNGDFAPSDVYLSGNVRQKMREAKAALEDGNEAMRRNIAALEKVMPPDIPCTHRLSVFGEPWPRYRSPKRRANDGRNARKSGWSRSIRPTSRSFRPFRRGSRRPQRNGGVRSGCRRWLRSWRSAPTCTASNAGYRP
jgi:N12 class adenine-specific DNA methylase